MNALSIAMLVFAAASADDVVFPAQEWEHRKPEAFPAGRPLVLDRGAPGDAPAGRRAARLNRVLGRFAAAVGYDQANPAVSGELRKWRPVVLDFTGPKARASSDAPNPFLDYRLNVRFTAPSGAAVEAPGYFAGDGRGGLDGRVWRCVFSPDQTGIWRYEASFRQGPKVAVRLDADAGEAAAFDGVTGAFDIAPAAESAEGFYKTGRLEYAGGHYLKLRDGGYWLKGGTDSPEDLLAYEGFVNTPGATHAFAAHARDWREGDPDWGDGAGRPIIGALNYLADQGVNSVYLLTMNIGGDGKNVYPYLGSIDPDGAPGNDNLRFDLAKVRQWGIVFEHAQRRGLMLHFVLNEAEAPNKRELDDGQLGVERKLYYRELAARFGHFPALQWNLCEEYNHQLPLAPKRVKEFAEYLRAVDPYDHPVTVHHAGPVDEAWAPFLGDPRFTVTSFQTRDVSAVERWRAKSQGAGAPLVIGMDEFFPDRSHRGNIERHRREYLWPVYFSGGQIEFILDELLDTEDFRDYEPLWSYMAIARRFMEDEAVFHEMTPCDESLSGEAQYEGKYNTLDGQVLAKRGERYAVYLPTASATGTLDLGETSGPFTMRWFNPRSGAFEGDARSLDSRGPVALGPPPGDPALDWAALLTRP
jgi:hypothetical protein